MGPRSWWTTKEAKIFNAARLFQQAAGMNRPAVAVVFEDGQGLPGVGQGLAGFAQFQGMQAPRIEQPGVLVVEDPQFFGKRQSLCGVGQALVVRAGEKTGQGRLEMGQGQKGFQAQAGKALQDGSVQIRGPAKIAAVVQPVAVAKIQPAGDHLLEGRIGCPRRWPRCLVVAVGLLETARNGAKQDEVTGHLGSEKRIGVADFPELFHLLAGPGHVPGEIVVKSQVFCAVGNTHGVVVPFEAVQGQPQIPRGQVDVAAQGVQLGLEIQQPGLLPDPLGREPGEDFL